MANISSGNCTIVVEEWSEFCMSFPNPCVHCEHVIQLSNVVVTSLLGKILSL